MKKVTKKSLTKKAQNGFTPEELRVPRPTVEQLQRRAALAKKLGIKKKK